MKHPHATNFGCPNTEMRSGRSIFEKLFPNLDLHMKADAPHYSSRETRIAYSNWVDNVREQLKNHINGSH